MRTCLKWTLPLLVLALLSYLAWGFTTKLHRQQEMTKRVQALPNFKAYTVDSLAINKAALANRPTVFIYFDPDCEHCQREADELRKKVTLLAEAKILMLSSAPASALKIFATTHQLDHIPNVQVAHIDRKEAYETFGFASVPDVLIYHADGSLSKRFRGETSIEAIARHL